VIYNGIDLEEYQQKTANDALTKYGIDPAKPYVLFVGRITRQKGVTHLVEAIQYMPKDVQVVLCAGAADTPEIAVEMREKVSAALGQNPNIFWIENMITKPEAIELYSHCTVFCCPSVYEPFGIINLEAMACKAPVVASATGGILEVVVEGETGLLVPWEADPATTFPADPTQFAKDLGAAVTKVLSDPERAKQMGEAGRKRVEEMFAWSAIADQTIKLYKSLLGK
jgi:starch synthase